MPDLAALARDLREEAATADERRLIVLHGPREQTYDAAGEAVDAAGWHPRDCIVVGDRDLDALPCERVPGDRSAEVMGTTQPVAVLDAHDALRPNALGRVAGAVDGGGLLLLLAPPLDAWPQRRDGFDEGLAVPPHDVDDVSGRFRSRLVEMLRAHTGVAVVDAATGTVEAPGLTDPVPRTPPDPPPPPADAAFPDATYEACRTPDQHRAVRALEDLVVPGGAVVATADRGRGKSSACGLAAGALASMGWDILVTAPAARNAAEVFARARELLDGLGDLEAADDGDGPRSVASEAGGSVTYRRPAEAAEDPGDPDAVVVDEAAALPVRLLEEIQATEAPTAYATTIHGYEGTGRGFSVRFRDRLEAAETPVTEVTLDQPIRYAAGDPVEVWSFRTLLLDARPPVEPLVEGARQASVEYVRPSGEDLADDEHLLREAFGLLVLAHYRTEPDDLARTLDAPNVAVRALLEDGHVASVALLAREGGLPEATRERMYEGARVPGNMVPDVLTSQLRDPDAGATEGVRVLRIATHPAVRDRGLGSLLLRRIREEFDVDWFGVGYGATPELLRFWRRNGYRTLHLSTSRNERSGEYSAIMMDPASEAGEALHDRTSRWFASRIASVLTDPLDDLDPDVAREALRAADAPVPLDLSDRDWRVVASAAYGPGVYDVAPGPFRDLALRHLVEGEADVDAEGERLLVRKALQAWPWDDVAEDLGYVSRRMCMRAFGDACQPLVDAYGGEEAREEAERYR
jgi:tRNA(Met) cytidine acetyltransferase